MPQYSEDEKLAMMQAHTEQTLTAKYDPSREYWDVARPTYMEQWPAALKHLSITSDGFVLSQEEMKALGSNIVELGEMFAPEPLDISGIRQALHDRIWQFPKGAFVRLGSRSPKDALYWGSRKTDEPSGRVKTAEEALWRLTACSERIMDDLLMAAHFNYNSCIWLREWLELEEWAEFRCFMRRRELIGISQYYYRKHYPELERHKDAIKFGIEQIFFPQFCSVSHLDDVVFDVFVKVQTRDKTNPFAPRDWNTLKDACGDYCRYDIKLLEVNPYFRLTDPCLFDWDQPEMFDGRMLVTPDKEWNR